MQLLNIKYKYKNKIGKLCYFNISPECKTYLLLSNSKIVKLRYFFVFVFFSGQDKPYNMNSTEVIDGVPLVGRERFYGYCSDLAEMVARKVGYEYHIRRVRDGHYGGPQGDGTWDGIIGELIRHVGITSHRTLSFEIRNHSYTFQVSAYVLVCLRLKIKNGVDKHLEENMPSYYVSMLISFFS